MNDCNILNYVKLFIIVYTEFQINTNISVILQILYLLEICDLSIVELLIY